MQVEKMGFPTAPLVTIAFEGLAHSNAASRGMPLERICFLPHPMTNKTDAEMYAVLEGNDPISKKPLMPEIIAALSNLSPRKRRKPAPSVRISVRPPTWALQMSCNACTATTT